MGGGQTVNIGFPNTDVFHYIGAFSSAPNSRQPAQNISDVAAIEQNLLFTFISCGDQDDLFNVSERYHNFFADNGVEHMWQIEVGEGHTPTVWNRSLYQFAQRIFLTLEDGGGTDPEGMGGAGAASGGMGEGAGGEMASGGSDPLGGGGEGGGTTGAGGSAASSGMTPIEGAGGTGGTGTADPGAGGGDTANPSVDDETNLGPSAPAATPTYTSGGAPADPPMAAPPAAVGSPTPAPSSSAPSSAPSSSVTAPPPSVDSEIGDDEGCGCSVVGSKSSAVLWPLALIGVLGRLARSRRLRRSPRRSHAGRCTSSE